MKKGITKLTFITIVMILITGCATMMGVKAPPEMRTFEKIVEISNQSKNDLYIKANSWFVETFNSAESVIEFQDKEAGKIMGKYVFSYTEGIYYYDIKQTISIDIKDSKVRIVISDPYYKNTGDVLNGRYGYVGRSYSILESQKRIEKARLEWNLLVKSLTTSLNKNTDW